MTDSLNLHGSLRYTDEDKDIDYLICSDYRWGSQFPWVMSKVLRHPSRRTGPGILVWIGVSRTTCSCTPGFPEALSLAASSPHLPTGEPIDQLTPYAEEINDSFEIGVKSNPTDALQVNAAAFFYDYQDAQGRHHGRISWLPQRCYLATIGTVGDAEHYGAGSGPAVGTSQPCPVLSSVWPRPGLTRS